MQAIKIQKAFCGYLARSIIEKYLDIDKIISLQTIKNILHRIDQEMKTLLTPLLLNMKRFEYQHYDSLIHKQVCTIKESQSEIDFIGRNIMLRNEKPS